MKSITCSAVSAHLFAFVDEAAEELGVTSARVRQMVLKSELAAEKFGRDLVITHETLAEAKKRKTTPGPSPAGKKASATRGTKG